MSQVPMHEPNTDEPGEKQRFPQGARTSAGKRALVVANETISGKQLVGSVLGHLGSGVEEIFVVAPALAGSALDHIMGDVDAAIPPARERLEATLREFREAGVEARGEVGDSDPIQAISDEIVKFEPDQILVVAHRDEEGAFAEKGLLEQAERDFDLPVLELVVTHEENPEVLDIKSTKAVAGRKKGWRPSYNWPPLTRREIGGILVAIVGTILLGILASKGVADSPSNGNDHEEGRMSTEAAAAVLLALGMALINLAHIVGLFLFQSVRYDGIFSRFFARLSLIGTPLALIASAVLVLVL
ncbi:MAG TPA: hypothetical protein VFS48_00005 [Solirubrobacterales bacterium]|nr:hypothetical protein [Solirubrobacterales bacterium]